ncbi:DUF6326 family protein [Chloroflexota bacterium]
MEDVRIKLSALWVARMLTGLQGDELRFLEPGMMAQMVGGEVEGMQVTDALLLVSAIIMVLPIVMVFLSLTLPYKASRWVNIVLAIFLFGFDLIGLPTYTSAYAVLLIVVGLAFNVLTVWYAWKWPKPDRVGVAA